MICELYLNKAVIKIKKKRKKEKPSLTAALTNASPTWGSVPNYKANKSQHVLFLCLETQEGAGRALLPQETREASWGSSTPSQPSPAQQEAWRRPVPCG